MNEQQFGIRIRNALNHGLKDIPPAVTRRLEATRHAAIGKQQIYFPIPEFAGTQTILPGHSPMWTSWIKQGLAIIALLTGMWLSFYGHSTAYVGEQEEIDAALLVEDLPPEAFLDNDFFKWLVDDSRAD